MPTLTLTIARQASEIRGFFLGCEEEANKRAKWYIARGWQETKRQNKPGSIYIVFERKHPSAGKSTCIQVN